MYIILGQIGNVPSYLPTWLLSRSTQNRVVRRSRDRLRASTVLELALGDGRSLPFHVELSNCSDILHAESLRRFRGHGCLDDLQHTGTFV